MVFHPKAFEVTGYVPPDSGVVVCKSCHDSEPHGDCSCDAVFLLTETESEQFCDVCGESIETNVIGAEEEAA